MPSIATEFHSFADPFLGQRHSILPLPHLHFDLGSLGTGISLRLEGRRKEKEEEANLKKQSNEWRNDRSETRRMGKSSVLQEVCENR